ncbi:MAG: hypothetical protein R3304_09805 [Longimicrobiales bacterium]|nr:hypothetical protein [Longimicrobiales bacterium]
MVDSNDRSGLSQLVAELRRRHVGRFALGYLASAFVILQLAEIVLPAFGAGDGGLRVVVAVAALGFPPALVLAWMYDLTREGITRTEDGATGPWLRTLALAALLLVTLLVTGGGGLYLARQGVFESRGERSGASASSAVAEGSFDPSAPIRSIAVLPLEDNSPSEDQAYFAASMHEELTAKLSQVEELRVVSRTSTMRYADTVMTAPEIGRALGVDVLVEGSVTRTPQRTRVTLQLIHAPSDTHIGSLQWDREEIDDVLAFQTEVAREVVDEVLKDRSAETLLAADEREVEPAAQEAYFRGRYAYDRGTPEGYAQAMDYFEAALEEDPDFAAALAGMAGARFLGTLQEDDVSSDELVQALEEARSAMALDSTSVEAQEVYALIEQSLPRVAEALPADLARPSPRRADVRVIRMPGSVDSVVVDLDALDTAWIQPLTALGERIEASVRIRHATSLQGGETTGPLVFDARQLMATGRYADAQRVLEAAVAADPDAASAWDLLVRAHVGQGDPEGAANAARRWAEAQGEGLDGADVRALTSHLSRSGVDGYWRWRLERLEDRRRSEGSVPSFEMATTHAALGNEEEALRFLALALRQGEPGVLSLRTDPVWDDLRDDERFREILRQARQIRFGPHATPPRPPGGTPGR